MKRGTKTDPLTTDDLTYLLLHADDMTPREIADARGKQYFTVLAALKRARNGALRSRLYPVPCEVCGVVVQGPRGRKVHPGCRAEKLRRRSAQFRADNPEVKSTEYVRRWRRDNPEASAALREREKAATRARTAALPEEERRAMAEKVHAADQRDQKVTRPKARRSGEEWTAEEDRIILERRNDAARDVALALGRTLWAVRHRRSRLIRAEQQDLRTRAVSAIRAENEEIRRHHAPLFREWRRSHGLGAIDPTGLAPGFRESVESLLEQGVVVQFEIGRPRARVDSR